MDTTSTTEPTPTPTPEPAPVPEPEPTPNLPRTWVAADIRNGMTLRERVAWDNNSAPEVVTAKVEFSTPQELPQTMAVLNMLSSLCLISADSVARIVAEPTNL